tara:strand:- start:1068 stop:1628 length:561 start_codon:yes stop_codon:yes gene_type:complete
MATESNIAALRGNFGDNTLTITFQAMEGDATATTISGPRGDVTGVTYGTPIAEGDLVELVPVDTTGGAAWCVAQATATTANPIGIAQHVPIGELNETMTQANQVTNKVLRTVVVEVFGIMTREVVLEGANTAVDLGDYLTVGGTTINAFDKLGAGYSTIVALADAAASSGDTIPALFGYYGLLSAN